MGNVSLLVFLYIISEAMYTCKLNVEDWTSEPNEIRIWLMLESIFFFIWIISGAIFVGFAHVFTFRSTIKDDKCLEDDDDVWNDRRIDDFLRYIKFDYFVSTLYISYLLMELYIASNFRGIGTLKEIESRPKNV